MKNKIFKADIDLDIQSIKSLLNLMDHDEKIKAINDHLMKLLPLDEINTCFHDNKDNCSCRKPQPGMILNAAKKRNIDLSKSYIIGDRKSDNEAGKLAGCKTIFVDYKYEESKPTEYDFEVTSLLMAAMCI